MSDIVTSSGLVREGKPITDWPTIRRWVLDRDENRCQICVLRVATDVDHIWPRRLGGSNHVSNLRAACGPCNKAKGERVDLASADPMHLWSAIDALDQKVDALSDEREQFERETMVRALLDRRVDVAAMYYRGRLQRRRDALNVQIAQWDSLLRALDREAERHLPDAEVIDLRPTGGAA